MGGGIGAVGSGNWYRWNKKATVEESLAVAVWAFREWLIPHAAGTFTWTWTSGSKSSVGYVVTVGDLPTITLDYRWRDSKDVRIPVRL